LFAKIPCHHFLGQKWTKEPLRVAELANAINHFNKMSAWSTELVFSFRSYDQRGFVITKIIDIAYECCKLRNYDSVVQLLSGLENAATSRLKQTWEKVSEKSLDKLSELRDLFSPNDNWKVYRAELSSKDPPAIPYLGLYLQALTFSEDGNPDQLSAPYQSLINWNKYVIIGQVVTEILKYQQTPYPVKEVPQITAFIVNLPVTARTDKELYQRSLRLEPRLTDEEKQLLKGQQMEIMKKQVEEKNQIIDQYKKEKLKVKEREKRIIELSDDKTKAKNEITSEKNGKGEKKIETKKWKRRKEKRQTQRQNQGC